MKLVSVILIGYLLGSLSPSALIGKIKKVDMRKQGTKNLGASNTMFIFGKLYGALVMIFDIAKSFASVKIAELILPGLPYAGILAGCASVVGHIFPFYMKFKGGKGMASYGGMILALDPLLFLILLVICLILMLIVNYGVAMPMSAGVLFPILYGIRHPHPISVTAAVLVSALIIFKHASNVGKAVRGEDVKIRDILKSKK